ncbi:hypothetical protein GOQ27_01460 [Clostridium sp. D2Q-11]|uniref:DUF4129 domain-containing protein n=1 Tax=Anaeromonas frigoriresistens TaxID=2683708 RepID=A0A942UQ29_9FIRM|nr:hypothetical protein [Anaeromonas frigoriresistens]MBS4537108.1 hypothetical protein [Anaeromonas frigoriresistens]
MFRILRDPNGIIRIVFEGLRYFILTIIVIGMVTEKIFIDRILMFTFMILILSNIAGEKLTRKTKESYHRNKIIPILGILVSTLFAIFSTSLRAMPIVFIIIYLFIWMQGLKLIIDIDTNKDIFRKFIITIFIGFLFSIDIIVGSLRWYIDKLSPYIFIFVVISLIYSIRSNMYSAYNNINSINKKKNLKRFNILSNIFIILMIFILANLTFDFLDIRLVIEKSLPIVKTIFYPIVLLISYIIYFLGQLFKLLKVNKKFEVPEMEIDKSKEMEVELHVNQNPTAQLIITYIGWISVAIIIIVIGYIIYRLTKDIEKSCEDEDSFVEEEKEFILKKKDILDGIINRVKGRKSEGINHKELNIVRKLFIEISLIMIKKGYVFKKEYTPREFLRQDRGNIDETEFIVSEYEKVRYGNKSPTKEKIHKLIEYKNMIEKQ